MPRWFLTLTSNQKQKDICKRNLCTLVLKIYLYMLTDIKAKAFFFMYIEAYYDTLIISDKLLGCTTESAALLMEVYGQQSSLSPVFVSASKNKKSTKVIPGDVLKFC